MELTDEDFERFIEKVQIKDGCWGWAGTHMGSVKRPAFNLNGRSFYAHIFSYLWYVGPIDKGLLACHSCDNVECTNPMHLWLGTQSENVRDSARKGRHYFTNLALANRLRSCYTHTTGPMVWSRLTNMKERKMNSAVPDLTPPGKPAKAPKTLAEAKGEDKPKKEKAPKAEKAPADPNAPKKERAPRQDYGFRADAVIAVVEEKGAKYRGQRKDWYDTVKAHAGKTVQEWIVATKKEGGDPPRGWLRFFIQDGSVTLSGGTEPKKEEPKTDAPANTPPAT